MVAGLGVVVVVILAAVVDVGVDVVGADLVVVDSVVLNIVVVSEGVCGSVEAEIIDVTPPVVTSE